MFVLGIDPGGKSGAGLLKGINKNDITVELFSEIKGLTELSVFIPKYKTFKYKLLAYFSEHLGRVAVWEDVKTLIDHIYLEDQYLDTKFLNPHPVKQIIRKRTWWEFALFQDFGNIIKTKFPNSWQSDMEASGRGIKRLDRIKIVKKYILDRWDIKPANDPACAIGIAFGGMLDELKIISDIQKPLKLL